MTRQGFLDRLRAGLRGLSPRAVDEIVADYDGHFAEGVAAGRTEDQVAEALGDPQRLARELRAEAGIKRWEEKRSPGNAVGAVFALLGLGAIDFLILLPIVGPVLLVILIVFGVLVGMFCVGAVCLFAGVFGLSLAKVLAGIGLIALSAAFGALHTLICIGLTNATIWYARLHMKVVRPALDNGDAQ
jgi:uncharacterized membrane protein